MGIPSVDNKELTKTSDKLYFEFFVDKEHKATDSPTTNKNTDIWDQELMCLKRYKFTYEDDLGEMHPFCIKEEKYLNVEPDDNKNSGMVSISVGESLTLYITQIPEGDKKICYCSNSDDVLGSYFRSVSLVDISNEKERKETESIEHKVDIPN